MGSIISCQERDLHPCQFAPAVAKSPHYFAIHWRCGSCARAPPRENRRPFERTERICVRSLACCVWCWFSLSPAALRGSAGRLSKCRPRQRCGSARDPSGAGRRRSDGSDAGRPAPGRSCGSRQAATRKGMLHALAGLIAINPNDATSWLAYSRAEIASGNSDDILQAATTAAYLAYTKAADKPQAARRSGAARRHLCATRIVAPLAQRLSREPRARRRSRGARRPIKRSARPTASASSTIRSIRIPPRRAPASNSPNRSPAATSISRPMLASPASIGRQFRAEDQQICVDGLQHGEHYTIVLRQGLPSSAVEQLLLRTATYDIYVRDRVAAGAFHRQELCPAARRPAGHSGRLRQCQKDRRANSPGRRPEPSADHHARAIFCRSFRATGLKQFKDSDARKIWKGTLDVASVLNKDVTTAFPVLEARGHACRPASTS